MDKGALIALSVLVVILVGSSGYLYYQWNTLNTTYQNYVSTHSQTDTQYDSLNSNYNSYVSSHSYTNTEHNTLKDERDYLSDIALLKKSAVFIEHETANQPANSYTQWQVSNSYAGYISVYVESSTTSNTYVRVIYSKYGVDYDETITVGTSGTAVFPALPTTISVRVGNTNLINGATETVTAVYFY